MCVPADAQLPDLDLPDSLPSGQRTTLTAADGATFAAYDVAAPQPTGTGFVILPDVRGLFGFYERLSDAVASAGFDTVAIDYFGRTLGTERRDPDWDPWPYVEQLDTGQVCDDVAAAVSQLRSEHNVERVVTVGFCMGGALSFRQGYAGHGLDGVIGFYGAPGKWRDVPPAIDKAADYECPVLGLFGGADEAIPIADVEAFDAALESAGVEHEMHVYPGAPHSFFDRRFDDFGAECKDAWRRMLAFARS